VGLCQVLHYKIDSMQERVSYLLSIGLDQGQVAACVSRFPQLFSLNVEANIAPKWRYLVDYIRTPDQGVSTVCSYPAYFSLSLANRCVASSLGPASKLCGCWEAGKWLGGPTLCDPA